MTASDGPASGATVAGPAPPSTLRGRRRAVRVALGANLVIALAKVGGAVVSGSKGLMAEAGHSIADSLNEVFLLTALRRGGRPATRRHPFGFGKEQFFWSLIAAMAVFVTGAVVAVFEGTRALLGGEHRVTSVPVAFAVLAVAAVADGASLWRAAWQLRCEAQRSGLPLLQHVRRTADPTVRTVLLEDTAGLLGVGLATGGLTLHQVTGQAGWDAGASIAIGVLLALVAFEVARDSKELLLGEAAHPDELAALLAVFDAHAEIEQVVDLLSMRLGPDSLLVAAHIDVADHITAGQLEGLADRLEAELVEAVPAVTHVFLDPAHGSPPVAVGGH